MSPDRAISDVRRIADLLASGDELTTALGRDVDAPPGEWRFRVYRRGAPAALSELLPLLDHLGLQALDERPYTFRLAADRVYVYDIGVRVGDRRRPRRAAAGRPAGRVHRAPGWLRRERRLQPARPARRAQRTRGGARAGVRQVPAPDRVRVQPGVRGSGPRRPPAPRRRPRRPVPHPLRPRPLRRHPQPRARGRGRGAGRRRSRPSSTPSRASTTTASAEPS